MEFKKLDKKAITAWRAVRIIVFLVFIFGIALINLSLYTEDNWKDVKVYIYALEGSVLLLYLLFSLILYPIIEYKQWGYSIENDKVMIRHGIFFVTTSIVPIIRIQHITMSRGPINRKLGLTKLIIHTASGQFAIEGLNEETANEVSENLKSKLIHKSCKAGS